MRIVIAIFISHVLCLLFVNACGQKIYFSDTTNEWGIYNIYNPTPDMHETSFRSYKYHGTAQFNNVTYQQLVGTKGKYMTADTILLREDKAAGKVYGIVRHSSRFKLDTVETLLYDYNLKVADTFINRRYYCDYYSKNGSHRNIKVYVEKIDSVLLQGEWHKVWTFSPLSGDTLLVFSHKVIEGIGCIEGLDRVFEACIEGNIQNVYCFTHKGMKPVPSKYIAASYYPWYKFDNSCYVGINDLLHKTSNVRVYPNPANNYVRFEFPEVLDKGTIQLINSIGQTIHKKEIHGSHLVTIDGINYKGVCYYIITDTNNAVRISGSILFD